MLECYFSEPDTLFFAAVDILVVSRSCFAFTKLSSKPKKKKKKKLASEILRQDRENYKDFLSRTKKKKKENYDEVVSGLDRQATYTRPSYCRSVALTTRPPKNC